MIIDGLTDFQKDLMKTSKEFPKQAPKALRTVGNKARSHVAKRARKEVGKVTGNYHKKWKRGKVFEGHNEELVTRVINSSPHAHLIEDGHRQVTKDGREVGFVRGKHVLKKGMDEFESSGQIDKELGKWLDKMLEKNKL